MNKIKNFMNKPITWGGYLKLCGVCFAITVAEVAAMRVWYSHGDDIVDKVKVITGHGNNENDEF